MAGNSFDRYFKNPPSAGYDPLDTSNKATFNIQEKEGNRLSAKIPKPDRADPFNENMGPDADNASSSLEDTKAKAAALDAQRKTALVTTALQAVTDVMASNTQYEANKGAAATNIYLMNHQKALIMAAGKQSALDRQMEGELNADQASIALAAQGQDLRGAGVDKVTSSYRAMALQNAAREEAKMYAEMAGVDIQIANQEYNIEMAGQANDMALYQGILNVGMSTGGYFAGKA